MTLISLFSKTPGIRYKWLRNVYSWIKNIYWIAIVKILKLWNKNQNINKKTQNISKVLPQKIFTESTERRLPKKLGHKFMASYNVHFVMFNSTPSSRYCAPDIVLPRWRRRRHQRFCRVSPWNSGSINVRFALHRSCRR